MSYRLINANTIAESYPEVNDMPCIYADIDGGLDGQHYDLRGASTLQAENAKLRELVRDMYEMAYPEYPSAFEAAFAGRMRELGIEASA